MMPNWNIGGNGGGPSMMSSTSNPRETMTSSSSSLVMTAGAAAAAAAAAATPSQLFIRPQSSSTTSTSTSPKKQQQQQQRGASSLKQFPGKLHDLLTYAESNNLDHIIGWVHNGSAFMVHDQTQLVEILPIFFGQTKFRSFQRQLNMWKFERVLVGPYKGAFMHPSFIRGNKELCATMTRSPTTSTTTLALSSSSSSSPSMMTHMTSGFHFGQHHHHNPNDVILVDDHNHHSQLSRKPSSLDGEPTHTQFFLGNSNDIVDRNQSPQQNPHPSKQQQRHQHQQQQQHLPNDNLSSATSQFDDTVETQRKLSWAEYTRRQAIMKGIESAEEAVELPTPTRTPRNTPASSEEASINNNNTNNNDLSRLENEESWGLLSQCLDRVMNNSSDSGNSSSSSDGDDNRRHGSHRTSNINLDPTHIGYGARMVVRSKYQEAKLLLESLPQGLNQPATPEQLQTLFQEMSGSFD